MSHDITDLRDAFEAQQFRVAYLPTVELASRRCVGAEALTRWRGEESPFAYAALRQDVTLAGQITYWLVDTVGHELGAWLRAHREAYLALNVPPAIIGRGGLAHAAARAGITDLLPQFVLEVTEHGVPDTLAVNVLNEARRDMGVRIALDDVNFALTNATLMVLSRVDVDMIKLGKPVVDTLLHDGGACLEALTALVRATGAQVVAEGVEHARQVELLKAAGCRSRRAGTSRARCQRRSSSPTTRRPKHERALKRRGWRGLPASA